MRTLTTLIIALFCVTIAYSQEAQTTAATQNNCEQHRILTYLGMGYQNSIYGKFNDAFIQGNYSMSTAFEAKYAWFWHPNWGVSGGLGLSHFWAKGTLNSSGAIQAYTDPNFAPDGFARFYDLTYKADNLVEKQYVWAFEIPIQAHYEHKFDHKYGIFAGLGARIWLPLSARSTFPIGSLTTVGYEEFNNAVYNVNNTKHFGSQIVGGEVAAEAKLRWSIDAIADFGGTMKLNNAFDLYVGLYGSYGFMDVLPKAANKKDFLTPEYGNLNNVNSLLASNVIGEYNKMVNQNRWDKASDKWNRWQIGVKVGLHLKPCNLRYSNEKSYRQTKKEFMEKLPELLEKAGKTIIIRDTIHVIYVYPPKEELTDKEHSDIGEIANLLTNGKILFDLDSDVPKIADTQFITETANLLRKNPNLWLEVEGYTCDLGTEKHNRDLATRRANAIRSQFIAYGVNPSQMQVAAYTVNDPQSKVNIPEQAREEHRAVIFRINKTK